VEEKAVFIPQHIHYAYRGEGLRELNLYEFTALISVVPIPQNDKESSNNYFGPGRKRNSTFFFQEGHPLVNTHYCRLASKQRTPILAGKRERALSPCSSLRRWKLEGLESPSILPNMSG
jgi:hypothetical protein